MTRFTNARLLADRLITKNGQAATLRQFPDAESTDPDKPWRAGDVDPVDTPVTVVVLPLDQGSLTYRSGTEMPEGAQVAYLAALTLTVVPSLRDQLLISGEPWSILSSYDLAPNGERILYELQVRR